MLQAPSVTPPDSHELGVVASMLEGFIEELDVGSHDEGIILARAGLMSMLTKARVLQSGRASNPAMTLTEGLEP